MKRIVFSSPTAQKVYDDYFKRVKRCIRILSESDQREMMMEINSHIYEATHSAIPVNEVRELVDALENLGAPEEVLLPLVASRKVKQASYSFNPKHIFQALYLNISHGLGFLIVALGYLFALCFGSLALFKMISPAHTGLFLKNGQFFFFGFSGTLPGGLTEVLGYWIIPIVLAVMAALYCLNTLLLRLLKRK